MTTSRDWRPDLHDALRRLWDPDRLAQSPLVELSLVQQRLARDQADLTATLDLAQALRQVLTEALEALRPAGSPQLRDRRWRQYLLLHDTYWQGHDNDTVMRRLYLSRTTFYREQRRAIAALAQALTALSTPASLPAGAAAGSEAIPVIRGFVGRAPELTHYNARLNESGRAVIQGPPGVGKTALGATLARQRPESAFWYTFRPDLNDDISSVVQAIGLFLGLDEAPALGEAGPLGPTVGRLLAALPCRDALLCLDDVHVVDENPALRSLLQALWAGAGRYKLLILSRHQLPFMTEPTWPALGGLSQPDAAVLWQQMGRPPLPPALFADLYQRTQGYPHLLRLFAASLGDADSGPADLARRCQAALAEMPRQRSVYAYLMDNVLRAGSPQDQEALLTLSAGRPPIPYEVAVALLDQPDQAARALLYRLVNQHILEETAEGTALTMHPLVREFCYALLAGQPSARDGAHRRAALAYEARAEPLQAAHHHAAAGDVPQATRLLLTYVDALLETGQAGPLAKQLGQLAALSVAPANMPPADLVALHVSRGRAQAHLGDDDGALTTYDRLLADLQNQPGPDVPVYQAQVYYWLAHAYEQQGHLEAALAALQRGLDGLPDDATSASPVPASPASAWQGRLLARIAQIHQRRGHHDEALATCQRGLALLPPAGHDDVVGDVYRVLAAIHHDQGNLAQAIAYAETALWASRRAGDVPGQIRSHLALADYYAQRGDYTAGEHIMQARLLQGNTRPAQEMIP